MPFYTKAQKLTGTFGLYHYDPFQLSEKTAQEVVDLFITELDSRAMTIKESDVKLLKENSKEFFNQINSNNDAYIEKANTVYLKALKTVDSILTTLSTRTLNFNENDTSYFLPYGSKKIVYSPTIKYHAKRLERYIKSKSYDRVVNTDDYEKLSETEFNAKAQTFTKTIISNFQKNIQEEIKATYRYVESTLLNAITLRYDPHSNYFTEEQNQEFNTQLSAQVESFGFFLDENEEGIITIANIEPGGSAWMSNEVNEGDAFIFVKIGNEKITNEELNAYEIQDKLDKTKEDKILLTVKKQNGLIKTVKLIKQKTASVDNSVKGYVLSYNNLKVGYISLPSFYTDMEDHNLPGCANDVAKEILKLENDTIKGLIIDLRNNGGGSMGEAMNLAGIFIDEGPLFIIKEKNRKPSLVKDINRGSLYKKPLLVMINETSASASELFSNIVKDYNLGVIVGQPSYGKGTAQSILPLDTNLIYSKNKDAVKNSGDFIKITNSKFYRLSGSTHQGNGVVPDVILPPTPGYGMTKENKELYFLPTDSIVKKVVYTPNPKLNTQPLQSSSAQRVAASKDFKRYLQISDSVNDVINKTQKVVLKFKEYKKFKKDTDILYNSLEKAFEVNSNTIKCLNNTFDLKLEQVNIAAREFNSKIIQSIQKDIFINESFNVMRDLINQTQ